MRVLVDPALCQGHARCVLSAPEVFALDDIECHAYVAADPVPDELAEAVRRAAESCPEQAITVIG
ncbi:ferredoxin [Frankia sp. CcI49]|uniref:ferredoxin n=1 Tax=Frankia sp. CcI49 TaxID=1745382 RepID=UPI000975DF95|nr:ferredoxin [Frankia sp. CcI49]ONH55536.1 ferredoxin [Frankia sp. CcI49]